MSASPLDVFSVNLISQVGDGALSGKPVPSSSVARLSQFPFIGKSSILTGSQQFEVGLVLYRKPFFSLVRDTVTVALTIFPFRQCKYCRKLRNRIKNMSADILIRLMVF